MITLAQIKAHDAERDEMIKSFHKSEATRVVLEDDVDAMCSIQTIAHMMNCKEIDVYSFFRNCNFDIEEQDYFFNHAIEYRYVKAVFVQFFLKVCERM